MNSHEPLTLRRDVEAAIIPIGTKVTLQQGEAAYVTQSLGGTYTVSVNGNLFRIEGKDADALGLEPVARPAATGAPVSQDLLEKEVWNQLRSCYDPEIPVNIVDLGLIYDCHLAPLSPGSHRVDVKMTLTAPGCGMGPTARPGRAKPLARPGRRGRRVRRAGLGPALEPGHDDRGGQASARGSCRSRPELPMLTEQPEIHMTRTSPDWSETGPLCAGLSHPRSEGARPAV